MTSLNDLPCLGCDTQGGCGTGTGNWPKPGDPDNNSVLRATPAFGGVDVEWSFPETNPHAVAHTRLYRAYSADFSAASLLEVVGGNFFYDKNYSEVPITYYYWIQIVSVNGTYGEVIGPASATPNPTIENMLVMLTGKIDSGVLAQSLKQEIDRIGINAQAILDETDARYTANKALSDALAIVQGNVDNAVTYINTEITERVEGQDALLQRINTLAVGNESMAALIVEEQKARIDGDSALASDILTMGVKVDENSVAIQNESITRADADTALGQQINTVQSSMGDEISSVRTEMATNIQSVDGKITAIGALYTAKVDVNGLVGGFGVYNDGSEVEAGFDVDRFWIGRTSANKRKPFIIEGGVVYIDDAAINKLTFSKLRSDDGSFIVQNGKIQAKYLEVGTLTVNEAQSTNYVSGSTGWKFFSNGNFEINGSNTQGRIRINPQGVTVWDGAGRLRVRLGMW